MTSTRSLHQSLEIVPEPTYGTAGVAPPKNQGIQSAPFSEGERRKLQASRARRRAAERRERGTASASGR
jgi:hypothetical protein